MSSLAPINGTQSLREAFTAAKQENENNNFGFMQINIDMDTNQFILVENETYESVGSTSEGVWDAVLNRLEDKNHTYFVVSDPINQDKFILIHFGPDLSPVRQRMIFASSRASLKSFFGSSSFSQDYYMSTREECSVEALINQRTLHERIDFRSDAEVEKYEASRETIPTTVTSQVMKNLPVQITESGRLAIDRYLNGATKTVFLKLDTETQNIEGEDQKASDIPSLVAALPENQPRYILFYYDKSDGSAESVRVFAYYCPEVADRKEKFTYSTCKANLLQYCSEINLEFVSKVETSSPDDFSTDFLDYHVFPSREEKQTFAMPSAPGKSKGKGKAKRQKRNILEDTND